ncbi:MAG TPA: dethiobiotin synthase [Bryobacteraceae bacterium]|nr:dethiobiotin synthase [Bryobacteraceae bacterium]
MLRGLFVTGTDTGVGKTVTCAALLCRCRQAVPVRYWKPIQTGIEQDDDTEEVRRLASCFDEEIFSEGIRLQRPVSPHLAAQWSSLKIELDSLTGMVGSQTGSARWIVEGAGGALVPINDAQLMTDLMFALGLPVVVVARSSLGTINHTLLTIEALRARDLYVAGVIMVGEKNSDNRAAIERYGGVSVVGEMPLWKSLDSQTLAEWAGRELDPRGCLLERLQ